MQAENVRGVGQGLRRMQRGEHVGRITRAVIRNHDAEKAAGNVGLQPDLNRLRIVPDTVAQQIIQQPFQQGAVHPKLSMYALMQMGMNANRREDALAGQYGLFVLSCILWLAAMFALAWALMKKRDVKA